MKTVELSALMKTRDPTWDGTSLSIWSATELSVGILTASLPPLRKQFEGLTQKILPSSFLKGRSKPTGQVMPLYVSKPATVNGWKSPQKTQQTILQTISTINTNIFAHLYKISWVLPSSCSVRLEQLAAPLPLEAHRRGAKVYLAMRDMKKELKGIKEGNEDRFIRVQADLTKPETIKEAVKTSGANKAFVAFEALKEAGITYVVLLSSFTVQDPPSSEANKKSMIGAIHSETEVALQESGLEYTAVRPAYFNSNVFWEHQGIKKGEAELLYPNVHFDHLAPSDIGLVCGSLLIEARFQKEAGSSFYLCGPNLLTQREAMETIGKALGKELKIKEVDQERWFQKLEHMPRPLLESLAKDLKESDEGKDVYTKIHEQAVKNFRKFAEREPTKLEDWMKEHKAAFE
ncbi:NAD-binding-10 domain containing protein [Pyrenophora tritici-repentis]|nr:NAD(P)-binding protein [Pyrenophora tritici-repentis]KAI1601210.1 NmrA-like family protein [Pyrenophora tritici-repentis]PZD36231.1 NAD-binding-10 domain containing protein [Pyrenophora tritici-repentis]